MRLKPRAQCLPRTPAAGLIARRNGKLYVWPEAVVDEWLAVLREVSLNRYPDPAPQQLMAGLRDFSAVPADAATCRQWF